MRERAILLGGAAILAAYGVVFLARPSVLAGLVGLEFTSANAPVEIRSFYGGLELGIAAFLFACAWRPSLVPSGLLFCALAFSCAGAARLLGVLQYGFVGPSQPFVAVLELGLAALCGWLAFGRAEASGAVHHVDITARDLGRSTAFYDDVLPLLGFRRGTSAPEAPTWAGAGLEVGLQPARSAGDHDRYAPGLHHLAFSAPSRAAVDGIHARLVALGVRVLDAPADYPQYAPGYYALFFADPDGIKLECVFTPRWPS